MEFLTIFKIKKIKCLSQLRLNDFSLSERAFKQDDLKINIDLDIFESILNKNNNQFTFVFKSIRV